jgi:phosphatidylglycerol:prolipoprotein diacylglycerol transferase
LNWTYSILMGAAVAAGVVVSRATQRPLGLSGRQRLALGLAAFTGGMLGAKLPFVLLDWEGFLSGAAWFDSGKTLVLGLVGGDLGVELVKWALDIHTKTGDSFAAPVAAAVAVGRLACFSAPCCYGTATLLPWGVDFGDGVRRHPTQLYEFVFHAACAVVLIKLQARGLLRGQLIKLYIIAYLSYRFATEYIRPEPRLWLELTAYQWAALAFVPLFIALWVRDQRHALRFGRSSRAAALASPGGP